MVKNEIRLEKPSKFKTLFGFEIDELKSWNKFVKLMNRPEDPANLAIFRILFGLVMVIDIPHERGMASADTEYGPEQDCYFPLFDFLQPLKPQYMLVLYSIMFMGALGIMLGFMYRISCLCFEIPYWYIFLLNKTTWNNHSYLYGLIGFMLFFCDANRFLSIDSLLKKSIRTHVPLWNYCLLRTQVFFVYFLAGIKKLDDDWISGYSMDNLGSHWVFQPFKIFLSESQVSLYIVHLGGLILDLTVGYLLFFDATRIIGVFMSTSFHIMNSRMFNIGMFPYTMLATTPLFYSNDWPKRLINYFTKSKFQKSLEIKALSSHCVYDKESIKSESEDRNKNVAKKSTNLSFYHKAFALFSIIYLTEQAILPFSHSITKGYNNWTNGLYGYSWDMMVHSWHTQHIKIAFVDKNKNKTHYLNPKAWTTSKRWSSHADMLHQYAKCIEKKLNSYNYTNIELYIDVWRSMNHRFNQRQLDPRINLLKAEWTPFKQTTWLMPLLTELSDWRTKMYSLEKEVEEKKLDVDLTFVADFPGLVLENYVAAGLNTTIEVLHGKVNVEIVNEKKNYTLDVGEKVDVPSGKYHNVYTISDTPSCFLYIYRNDTSTLYSRLFSNYKKNMDEIYNKTLEKLRDSEPERSYVNVTYDAYAISVMDHTDFDFIGNLTNSTFSVFDANKVIRDNNLNATSLKYYFIKAFHDHLYDNHVKKKIPFFTKLMKKFDHHVNLFKRSFRMAYFGFKSIITREDFITLLNRENQ